MLSKEWVPTPLLKQGDRQPVEIVAQSGSGGYPTIWVLVRCFFLWAQGLFLRIIRRYDADQAAVRTRELFEELGGLWIKVGQLLSLRTDIFSASFCREMSRLQYRAQGFPIELVYDILRKELNEDIGSVFEHFDETPVAAASVSQVHSAVLRHPKIRVAVKVRRPDAEAAFLRDMRSIKRMIRGLAVLRVGAHVGWNEAYRELEDMVREELDFRYEASNTERTRKMLREHGVYVPKVFIDLCSRQVLVTEFIDGVLMSDFIHVGTHNPDQLIAWCRDNNVNPRKVGHRLFQTAMRQLLEDNLFHADIHPGNILLLRDSRFTLIDFGTIGSSEKSFLQTYKSSLRALAEKDYGKAADFTLRLATRPPNLSVITELRKQLIYSYRYWESRTHLKGLSYHEKSLAAAGGDSGRIMYQYKVQLSWAFMRISRTWSTLDASISFLLPNADYMRLFGTYFRKASRRRNRPKEAMLRALNLVRRTRDTVEEYNLILSPMMHQQAMKAASLIDKTERLAGVITTVLDMTRTILVVGGVIYAYAFIKRHHADFVLIEHELMARLTEDLSPDRYDVGVIILMVIGAALYYLRKIGIKLRGG